MCVLVLQQFFFVVIEKERMREREREGERERVGARGGRKLS